MKEGVVLLNKEQCIALAGLAAIDPREAVIVRQEFPTEGLDKPRFLPVEATTGSPLVKYAVTTMGTTQRLPS